MKRPVATRIARCAQCGATARCPALTSPGYPWWILGLDPPLDFCAHEHMDEWTKAHPWSMQAWTDRYLERLGGATS